MTLSEKFPNATPPDRWPQVQDVTYGSPTDRGQFVTISTEDFLAGKHAIMTYDARDEALREAALVCGSFLEATRWDHTNSCNSRHSNHDDAPGYDPSGGPNMSCDCGVSWLRKRAPIVQGTLIKIESELAVKS